jgi:hypothetical protein
VASAASASYPLFILVVYPMAVDLTGPALAQSRPARPAAGQELPARALAFSPAEAEAMLLDRNLAAAAARGGVDISRAQRLVADTSPAGSIGYSQTTAPVNEGGRFSGYNGGRYVSPLNNASVNLFVTIERGGKRALRARLAEEQISGPETQVLYALHGQVFTLRTAFMQGLRARANPQWHWPIAAASTALRPSSPSTCGRAPAGIRPAALPGKPSLLRPGPGECRLVLRRRADRGAAWRGGDPHRRACCPAARSWPGGGHPRRRSLRPPRPLRRTPPRDMTRKGVIPASPNRPAVLAASRGVNVAEADTRLAKAACSRDLALTCRKAQRAADAERDTGRR